MKRKEVLALLKEVLALLMPVSAPPGGILPAAGPFPFASVLCATAYLLKVLWTGGCTVLSLVLSAAAIVQSKWLQLYIIMSDVNDAVRVFKWVVWLLGFLPKGDAAGA